jgi:hypothetical protein
MASDMTMITPGGNLRKRDGFTQVADNDLTQSRNSKTASKGIRSGAELFLPSVQMRKIYAY